jgi:hypothetical protein
MYNKATGEIQTKNEWPACYCFLVPYGQAPRSILEILASVGNVYAFMNVQQALGIHTSRQGPLAEKKTKTYPLRSRQTIQSSPRSSCITVCVPQRPDNETSTRQSTQSDSHTDHDFPGPPSFARHAKNTLETGASSLHADGLVACAPNSATRLSNFRLLFPPGPPWAFPGAPDFRHANSATSTLGAGRCLRPRL